MEVLGYSERGIVTALFYGIANSPSPERLLTALLERAHFPFIDNAIFNVEDATILVEQSFSHFGSADVVLLIDTGAQKICVFVEAKVKPSQTATRSIQQEYDDFIKGTESKVDSSNLFTQLYHKVRLIAALNEEDELSALRSGIPFPKSSARSQRKIGTNPIVLEAVEKVKSHANTAYYLAIAPDQPKDLDQFFRDKLIKDEFADYVGWNVNTYGYLSWSEVEEFCTQEKLESVLRVFRFNKNQIYRFVIEIQKDESLDFDL